MVKNLRIGLSIDQDQLLRQHFDGLHSLWNLYLSMQQKCSIPLTAPAMRSKLKSLDYTKDGHTITLDETAVFEMLRNCESSINAKTEGKTKRFKQLALRRKNDAIKSMALPMEGFRLIDDKCLVVPVAGEVYLIRGHISQEELQNASRARIMLDSPHMWHVSIWLKNESSLETQTGNMVLDDQTE